MRSRWAGVVDVADAATAVAMVSEAVVSDVGRPLQMLPSVSILCVQTCLFVCYVVFVFSFVFLF